MAIRVIETSYAITSQGDTDADNLFIDVSISKGPSALSGVTEEQILLFVRNYLQSLTTNPINITKRQTVETDGL